jgi:DNA polymerase V
MYLAKVAMDIVAKHIEADSDGVRIAYLDEMSYRHKLWNHTPLTDFWRVGRGYVKRLENLGLFTMGDIARCSLGKATSYHNEDLLYKEFGVNAELLIDHAWGYEPTTIQDIKNYKPKMNSLSSGQVLHEGYKYDKAKIVVKEMMDSLALDLVNKGLVTNCISLSIGYDIDNLKNNEIMKDYQGEVVLDYMGRNVSKGSHGSIILESFTYSSKELKESISKLYDKIINPLLLVRRINIGVNVVSEKILELETQVEQLSLFESIENKKELEQKRKKELEKDYKLQKSLLEIKKKFGKNSVLKGMDYEEGATQKDRNEQIGGHKA